MESRPSESKVKRIIWKNSGEKKTMGGKDSNEYRNSSAKFEDEESKKRGRGSGSGSGSDDLQKKNRLDGPCMLPLLTTIPKVEEWNSKATSSSSSIVLTGTARRGGIGPSVGAVDIGVSNSAYFFRVALPGVNKDPGQFSCEIESDGKVHVRGVTSTGGRSVSRHSRVFKMNFRQQCPPGPFTLSFSLPGPVDPRLFSPYFRSDGILEAVVLKYE